MSPDFLLCDVCGGRIPEGSRIFVGVEREPCPAGGPSEDKVVTVDLCGSCWGYVVCSVLRQQSDYELGVMIVEAVKTRRRAKNKS